MKSIVVASLLATLAMSGIAFASDRPDHYQGEPSATLDEAVQRFTETNARIEELLSNRELDAVDLATVHELTYSLENALERIEDEYEQLAEQLEALHLASEGADVTRARELGERYLENAQRFLQ